jgi:hypothetical protein
MSDKHKIKVKTEDEMIAQLKLLLNNGYSVAVNRDVNNLNLEEDDVLYTLVYCEQKKGE